MPSIATSGTQTAVIGTEHTLATISAPGSYLFVVDTNQMAAGDTLELRIYLMTLATSTSRVAYKVTFSGAQPTDDTVKLSVPVEVTHQVVATLKQTAGTGRSFDWEVVQIDTTGQSVSTKTGTYSLTAFDDVVFADATGGAFTLTLPTAVGRMRPYWVKAINTNANAVTVATSASQTIDGAATLALGPPASGAVYQSVTLISDGANWRVV